MIERIWGRNAERVGCISWIFFLSIWIVMFCQTPIFMPSAAAEAESENHFSIDINESNVDDFFPAPDLDPVLPGLRRSIDPLGAGLDWFQFSRIQTGRGGIRISDMVLNSSVYWMDMQIDLSSSVTLNIMDMQPGSPPDEFPHWGFGNDIIDFRLTETDIFGPPPHFTMFNVGVGGEAYHLDFILAGSRFILSDMTTAGYIHYFPDDTSPQMAVITDVSAPPPQTDTAGVCFSDLPTGTPMALFDVPGPDGEDYLNVNYCGQTIIQKFNIHDGIALGIWGPPQKPAEIRSLNTGEDRVHLQFLDLFSQPSREEKLKKCIEDRTTLTIGLQRDNQLGKALFELAASFAGELNLAGKTLNAAKDTLQDSKDVIADMMATGKMDSAKLSEFVLKTVLKNATPGEHEAVAKHFFDNNVPENVKTLAEGSGTAMEAHYKTALLGIIKGGVENYFPRTAAIAKTLEESQKWAVEAMADEDIRILYRKFKEDAGGDWVIFNALDWKYRANKQKKIRQILEKKGKSPTNTEVQAYMKNLFQGWYGQENAFQAKRAQLEDLKDRYDNDFFLKDGLAKWMPDANECERLLKLQEWFGKARLDILESMGSCTLGRPDSQSIQDTAFSMVQKRLRASGTPAERLAEYQKIKLDFLQLWGCLHLNRDTTAENNTPSGEFAWVHSHMLDEDAKEWIERFNKSYAGVYEHTGSYSPNNFSITKIHIGKTDTSYNPDMLHGEGIAFDAAFSQPPEVIEGKQFLSISMSLTPGENNLSFFTFWGSARALFRKNDYAASDFMNDKGEKSFRSDSKNNWASFNETLTAVMPDGNPGDTLELQFQLYAGPVMRTKHVYEWKQVE